MDWIRTRSVLADLEKLLTCAICNSYLKDPCTLDNCDHNFCRECIQDTLESVSECPECGIFSWPKDLRSNHQLAMTVNMTLKLQSLIGLNMEVEECAAPTGSGSSSRNSINFDQEMPDEDCDLEQKMSSDAESIDPSKPDMPSVRANISKSRSILVESDSEANHTTITESTATEITSLKQITQRSKSGRVKKHNKKINHQTVQCSTADSDSEENHTTIVESTATEYISWKENTSGSKSGRVRTHNKKIIRPTVECSTAEANSDANHSIITENTTTESTSWKQNPNGSKSDRVRKHKKKIIKGRNLVSKKPSITYQTNSTKSMENRGINLEEATKNNDVHKKVFVKGHNGKSKKSKKSRTKIKQRTRITNECKPVEILETSSVCTTGSPNFKEPGNKDQIDHTSMEKSNDTTKAAKRTTIENSSDGRPSMQTKRLKPDENNITQSKDSSSCKMRRIVRKTSEQDVPRKKYFFRNKQQIQREYNLVRGQFDFTQQEDPFHFARDDSDDNSYDDGGSDDDDDIDDHNSDDDGSGDDDGGSDDDDNNDIDYHNSDDDGRDDYSVNNDYGSDDDVDNDNDDGSNKQSLRSFSKSRNNILQSRKTRQEKSHPLESADDIENNKRVLRSTSAINMRLRNKVKSRVTAEHISKTQFTHLKDRPNNSKQSAKRGDRKDSKKTLQNGLRKPDTKCRDEVGEDKENVTLNIKRRRFPPKQNNIRQYFIAVDSANTSDNSSDSPLQKRKKLRSFSTSSSQNTRNAAPSSQCLRNKKGETPLHLAAIKGDLDLARELINEGADPNAKDHAGWTPLHEACNHGHVDIVELFLDHDALLNIPGFDNDTPLHDAVSNGRLKVVKLLVARGAVKTARNKQGLLPIDYAVTKKMKAALSQSGVSSGTKLSQNIENVKKSADFCRESQVILGTALNTRYKVILKKCIKLLGGTLVDEFDESVTHVVTSVNEDGHCPRTIKYLSGILTGKWIVNFEWIKNSLRQRQWLDEDVYEVEGTVGISCYVPRKGRFNALQQMPRLFDGCSFFLRGEFKPPTASKEDLIKLIKQGGGKVLHREPKVKDDDLTLFPSSSIVTSLSRTPEVAYHAPANSTLSCCTEFIIYDSMSCDQPKIVHSPVLRTAPVTWLMDCISSFQLLDIPDE